MNAQHNHGFDQSSKQVRETRTARDRAQSRSPRRARDFGVGYGNSSGYASMNERCYAESWAKQPFSCW